MFPCISQRGRKRNDRFHHDLMLSAWHKSENLEVFSAYQNLQLGGNAEPETDFEIKARYNETEGSLPSICKLFVVFLVWLWLKTDASVCRGWVPAFGADLVKAACYTNTNFKAYAKFSPLYHVKWCRSLWWWHLLLRPCWYPVFVHDRAICWDPEDVVITIAKLDFFGYFFHYRIRR
jgi:hypothetical protein